MTRLEKNTCIYIYSPNCKIICKRKIQQQRYYPLKSATKSRGDIQPFLALPTLGFFILDTVTVLSVCSSLFFSPFTTSIRPWWLTSLSASDLYQSFALMVSDWNCVARNCMHLFWYCAAYCGISRKLKLLLCKFKIHFRWNPIHNVTNGPSFWGPFLNIQCLSSALQESDMKILLQIPCRTIITLC